MTAVLVAYASKNGSTREIAEEVAQTLSRRGLDVTLEQAQAVGPLSRFDVVIVGSAVYAGRWRKEAVAFLKSHAKELRARPLWLFQSGPLDASAEQKEIALPGKVSRLAAEAGSVGHVTFGGKLDENASGFVARSMAKKFSADFRNMPRIGLWAGGVADEIEAQTAGHLAS